MSNTTAEGQTGKTIVVKGNRIGSTEKGSIQDPSEKKGLDGRGEGKKSRTGYGTAI